MKTIIALLALATLPACSTTQPLSAGCGDATEGAGPGVTCAPAAAPMSEAERQLQVETKVNFNPSSVATKAAQR